MQQISFKATVKDGHIKIPEGYSDLNNKEVLVEILDKDITAEEKEERVKNAKEFIRKCTGILKNTNIPPDITMKKIREMRLKEKYGI
ncbi:MAG: hypothetical protein PVH61_02855 [Candidatus Aminicenantes bacterium]|jgi:hypothetical protein